MIAVCALVNIVASLGAADDSHNYRISFRAAEKEACGGVCCALPKADCMHPLCLLD